RRVRATLAERETYLRQMLGVVDVPVLGIGLVPLTALSIQNAEAQGLFVYDLEADGIAARSGLREEDIILRAGGEALIAVDDLDEAIDQLRDRGSVELLVRRGVRRGTVTLRTERL
ncbi:MAG: PDZ domain-containing protein, partial [Planctomycetota bacterium]